MDGLTQPLTPAEADRIRALILGYPGVTAIRQLLFTFVGPGRVWIVARIDIDDGLPGAQVKALVRGIESGLKHESEDVYRVDVVAIGAAQAGKSTGARAPDRELLSSQVPDRTPPGLASRAVGRDGMLRSHLP